MKTIPMADQATGGGIDAPIRPIKPKVNNNLGLLRRIRRDAGALLEYLWELSGSFRLYEVDAAVISGSERHSGEPIRTFYMGHYDNYAFILNELYSDYEVEEKFTGLNSLGTKRWLQSYHDKVDMLFADVELLFCRMLPRSQFLGIPQWVRQRLDVSDTWEGVMNKFRKNTKKTDLRKVRKYNFTYKLTRSEEDFRMFYHQMYKPYLERRFRDAVIIEPEWKVMRQCRKGELMQIVCRDEVVAAVLLHSLAGRLAYVWVGVPDHISEDEHPGAFSAMFFYTILYGYEHGCHEIDFLGSRPLLNDGLFRYKRKWGTQVKDSPVPRGDILLRPLRLDKGLRSFFSHNHFIVRAENGIAGKLLLDEHPATGEDLGQAMDYYFTPGLECLKVASLHGFNGDAERWVEAEPRVRLIDLSKTRDPAQAFCAL